MAGDPRSQAAGRTGGTQPPVAPEWLQPNPGQTPSDGGLLLEESNAHKIEVANSIAAAQKVAKDVAATNIEDLKKKNAGLLQQGQQFQEYGPGWWESLKNVGADVVNEMGTGATGFLTGALAAGQDTLAPSQRDPLLRTAYLSAPNAQTFNAELAVNRALSQHPELIAKPYLLLNAAMKDMDAHDVKYMDVMDTMMKYYQAAILNPKGLQNAAEAINNRIKQTPATQMQNTIGTAVKDVANVLGKGGQLFGEAQRWVEKSFIELGGGTATEKQVDGKPMLAVTPGDNFLGQATGFVTNQFGMATEAVKKTWEIADSNMFGIQHAIRTEDHIRRTQGDQAANEYLSVWFGTAVALNLFGKGFALMLRGMEQTALRRTLEKAGVSTDVATNLLQLQQMAKVANMDDAKWIRLVRASQDWLMHQPQNVRIPMFSRYMELGKALPEEEALTASLSKRVGNTITQYGTPVGRLVKDAATYGQRHWHIPLNLELSAQLLGTTNNFGFGNNWDKAWAATADGNNYIDPITHRKKAVSFGRVVADTAGLDENTWWYNRVSGALDFLSWFEFDPFQSVLAPLAETKQLVNEGVLSRSYPGQGMRSASDVYRVFATRQKARDFASHVVQLNRKAEPYFESAAQTARMNRENKIQRTVEKWRKQGLTQAQIDARLLGSSSLRPLTEEEAGRGAISISPQASSISQLIKSYPHLLSIVRSDELASGDNFIVMLSHAKTEEDVINIFASAAEANGYLNAFRAPSRSRFLSFKDYLRNQTEKAVIEREQKLFSKGKYGDAAQVGINSRAYRAFISVRPQFWDEFSKWSNKVVRVGAPESLDMLSRVWRASGVNPLTVDLLINRLAMSRDAKEWGTVYTNWVKDTFAVYVDSMLLQRLNMGVLNTKQATQIRNIVNKELQNAIDELGNPFGGGAANRVYSGADINNIVDPKRPFPNSNGMEDTAGITSKNEHYLAIPDYTQVEKIIGDMEKFLRSKDGEASIFQTIKEMIAKPFDDKLAEIQKQQDDIVANLAKTANTAPMKTPAEEFDRSYYNFQDANQEKIIHSGWSGGNVYRHVLEGLGDIFRELSIRPEIANASYIEEKIRRFERHLEKEKEIVLGKRHFEDSFKHALNAEPDKIAQLKSLWEQQPYSTKAQKIAIDLNIAALDGDFKTVSSKIEELKKLKTPNGDYPGMAKQIPNVAPMKMPAEESDWFRPVLNEIKTDGYTGTPINEETFGDGYGPLAEGLYELHRAISMLDTPKLKELIYDYNNQPKQAFENFQRWYNNGDIIVHPDSVPMVIHNNKGQIVAWGDIEVYAGDEQAINLGGAFDADAIPLLIQELAKQAVLSTDESFRIRNFALSESETAFQFLHKKYPKLADYLNIPIGYNSAGTSLKTIQRLATSGAKDPLLNAEILPTMDAYRVGWLSEEAYVNRVFAQNEEFFKPTVTETALGKTFTPQQRFATASQNDSKRVELTDWREQEHADELFSDYQNQISELKDLKPEIYKTLESLFPDFTPQEIKNAFEDALNYGLDSAKIFSKDFDAHDFISEIAVFVRYSDNKPSYELIHDALPQEVIDILDEANGYAKEFAKLAGIPEAITKYATSSQRERAWLRSFTLDQEYSGFRHSLGEITPKELEQFKKFVADMDTGMEQLDQEVRVVRILNPDEVAGGKTYLPGTGDFPGSIKVGKEYVTPLPFTLDKSTGFVRPMTLEEVVPGAILHDPSFQSTSFGKYFGAQVEASLTHPFARPLEDAIMDSAEITHTVLNLTVPPQIKAIDATTLSPNDERELILQRGLTSVITHVEVVKEHEFTNKGVLQIYAAVLPQGAQENPMVVYMRNRERLDALAMDRLVTSGKSWVDMENKIKELDRRVAANKASRAIEPQDKPIKGFQQDVIDRLRREISMRGETVGLNYEQIKQLQSFADMIGEDMFEGVRLRTISRAKGADSTIVGSYEFANKLINLYSRAVFDEKGINRTLIHELWHHLSTFLPEKEVAVFSKNLEKARQRFLDANDMVYWRRTIDDEYIKNLEELAKYQSSTSNKSFRHELNGIKYIDNLIKRGWHKDISKIIWDSLPDAYAGGIENYRLASIDEYFAETMYDRTMSKLSSTNPIVEFAYNIISKIIQGIGKFSDAFASRRVFDNFINQRYAASNGVDLNLSLRSIPKNRYQREVNMALNPQHSDPTWRALEEKRIDLEEQRKQALEEAMGNKHIFSTPEKMVALPMNGIYGFHSWVRRAFIDNFFRKLVLATGSFSMRVSASEAIANAFRLGPVEYSKASLFSHIDTATKAYEKMYKTKVTAEEMPFLQRWVYDRLRNITGDDIEFYTESLAKEGVRLGKRIKRDFLDGLTSGKAYDELVQIITKDALVNGSAFLGISADEAGVYGGGADSVESQMRNITSGRGTGQWHKQTNVNNKTMVDMTKVLSDIATDNLSRGAAIILDNYFNPQKFIGWDFAKRLDHAMEDVRQFVRMSVNKNPREYDNMKRRFGVLPQTRDKIADDIRSENGLSASSPIQGSLLDELKDRLQKVNPLDEWANATVQHILWATHGRGPTGGFDFPNMGGRVFHRRILSALARGEYPQTAKELEALYLSPDLEHARVMQHQKSTKGKGGAQAKAYHDILYNRNFKYSDDSTFDPLEVSAQSTASTPGELEALKKKLINMHKPVKLKTPSRAKRQFRREMSGISRRYDDIHGQATSLFPDNIPGQDYNELSGISGLADKMSNFVHDTFSRKIIDSVSRRPLYYLELQRQLKFLKPFVDSGAITEDTAFTIAQSRAITIGIKYVHNPQDRLIFEQWSRAYAPFWFAENQAFKRMGRMALENPAGFEQYMLTQLMFMYTAKHSTENLDNQNGVLIPTSVAGGQMFTSALRALSGGLIGASGNVPIGLTGSLTSLNSVFPWNDPTGMHTGSPMALVEHLRPEFSPVVSAPLKIMQTLRPYGFKMPLGPQVSTTGLAESVLGEVGANADWLQMFMPNPALRSLIQEAIAIPSFFDSSGNVSSFTRQIDNIQYGLIGQYYADKTNEIKDKARKAAKASWYSEYGSLASAFRVNYPDEYNHYIDYKTTVFMRTGYEDRQNPALGFKSVDEYWNDRKNVTDLIRQTRSAAMAIYLGRTALSFFSPLSLQTTKVNPEITAYLRSLTKAGMDTKKLRKVLVEHPEYISFALARQSASGLGIPLEATFAVQMFQEHNADLFQKGDNLAGLYAFTPWSKKYDEYSSKEYQIQDVTGVRKKLSMQDYVQYLARQTGNFFVYDYIPKTDPEDDYGATQDAQRYGSVNVAWSQSQGDAAKNRAKAFREIESILKIPGIAKREGFNKTVPVIKRIIELYHSYQDDLNMAAPGNSQALNEEWVAELESIKKQHPEATYSIETLFKNMKLRDVK